LIELYDNKKFNKRFLIQAKIMFYGALFIHRIEQSQDIWRNEPL